MILAASRGTLNQIISYGTEKFSMQSKGTQMTIRWISILLGLIGIIVTVIILELRRVLTMYVQ